MKKHLYNDKEFAKHAAAVQAQWDDNEKWQYHVYWELFPWFRKAIIDAGPFDRRTNMEVRKVWKKAQEAWKELTGLREPPGGRNGISGWRAAYIAAGGVVFDVTGMNWQELADCLIVWAQSKEKPEAPGPSHCPLPPDGFRFDGREYRGLQPSPWRFLNYLWSQPDRAADLDTAVAAVMGEGAVYDRQPKDWSTKLNSFFRKKKLPFRSTVKVKARQAAIIDAMKNTPKKCKNGV